MIKGCIKTKLSIFFGALLISGMSFSEDSKTFLASWHDGKTKQTIVEFVQRVTAKDSKDFVPESERIAVFDNDGTLWAEQPLYAQLLFAIDRIYHLAPKNPQWQTQQPFASLLQGDVKAALAHEGGVNAIVMAANTGVTDETYTQHVKSWIGRAKHPVTQRLISKMVYLPMLELVAYLQAHDFTVFIVSGGGAQFIRAWSRDVYGIPAHQVVGSTFEHILDEQAGRQVLIRKPQMAFYNNHHNKVIAINNHIGKRPIIALGNSDGDLPMLAYTAQGNQPSLAMLVHHTDAEREWAYDRESEIGRLDKALDEARKQSWYVISMKEDWKQIFTK